MKVLVLGDSIIDVFVECESAHLAQEGPIVCANERERHQLSGGAGAVYQNCCTLFGEDNVTYMNNGAIQTKKIRYYADGHLLFRVDQHKKFNDWEHGQKIIEHSLALNIHTYDIVLIADYGKGLVTDRVLAICHGAKKLLLDPHSSRVPYRHCKASYYFPNRLEWEIDGAKTPAEHLILTIDKNGVFYYPHEYPSRNLQPNTVIGAGGALMAAFAYAIAEKGWEEVTAIEFALKYVAEAMKQPWQCVLKEWPIE